MILRKINAWLSLVTTVFLLNHAIIHAVWMLAEIGLVKNPSGMAWIMYGLMMIHAIISIVLAVLGHKGAGKRKCNEYPKMNIPTNIQRMSGVLLILLTALHIAGTVGILTPPKTVHAILPTIFFTITMAHVSVSVSKAFITLGIGSAKFIKVLDIAVKVMCAIILIADIIGFYIYAL